MVMLTQLNTRKHVTKNNRFTGVVLNEHDIFVLYQIYLHASMRSPCIHDMYQMFADGNRNSNSITNKLKRMKDAGILYQMKEPIRKRGATTNASLFHYRLGVRGVEVLVEEGLVDEDKGERNLNYAKRRNLPSFHSRCCSNLANNILVHNYLNPLANGMTHARGSQHVDFGITEETKIDRRGLIVPDWVFEKDNVLIALEVDTGSQGGQVIQKKYKRYLKMASLLAESKKQLNVIFAVTDESVLDTTVTIDTREEPRSRRIAFLKGQIPIFMEWPSNLNFYIVTSNRVPAIVERLITEHEPVTKDKKMYFIESWDELMESYLPPTQSFEFDSIESGEGDIVPLKRARKMDAECIMTRSKGEKATHHYLTLYGAEGCVRTYQTIRNNLQLAREYNANPNNHIPLDVLILYYEKQSALEDVYGLELDGGGIYTSVIETMTMKEGDEQRYSLFLHLTSPYKKVEVDLFK